MEKRMPKKKMSFLLAFLFYAISSSHSSAFATKGVELETGSLAEAQIKKDITKAQDKKSESLTKKITIGAIVVTAVTFVVGIASREAARFAMFPGFGNTKDEAQEFRTDALDDVRFEVEVITIQTDEGALRGLKIRLKESERKSDRLESRIVIAFGGNAKPSTLMAACPVVALYLKYGAIVLAVDPLGYGESDRPNHLSEKSFCRCAEMVYNFARKKYPPENITVTAYSMSAALAAHIGAVSSKKGEKIHSLVLMSPMPSIPLAARSVIKFGGFSVLGSLSAVFGRLVGFDMNTLKSLEEMSRHYNECPICLVSGDERDFLSFCRTDFHKKVIELGFTNCKFHIASKCDHGSVLNDPSIFYFIRRYII
jgi:hypothetical protein